MKGGVDNMLIQEAISKYLDAIREDYRRWTYPKTNGKPTEHYTNDSVKHNMTDEFCTGLEVKLLRKWYKVITNDKGGHRSVHSFIVKEDMTDTKGKDWKKGDILKASGWQAPALNKPRGNIFGDYKVAWTGALYLTSSTGVVRTL